MVPTMKKAIDERAKQNIAFLAKHSALDQIRIKVLEKKVQELKEIDDLNRNLVELGTLDRRFLVANPKLVIANNLLMEIYKSKEDPKLVKIITCYKRYAAEIKDYVGKLSGSLGDTMDHLIKHEDRLLFKTKQELQRSSLEI
jgi:endo-1,4-beta-mannosidase